MIVCAGRTEVFSFARPIGVGLIESAYNLSRILKEENLQSILFVGSCGSYGGLAILESFFSSSAAQMEQSVVFGSSYTPIENKIVQNVSHETIINSSNYITTDKNVSDKFLQLGLGAENMEFFSVLWAAREVGVEAKGFFVTTNYCSPNAREEYAKNIKSATEIIYDRYGKELKEYE
jgi:purine-nucleoside phosphorylase